MSSELNQQNRHSLEKLIERAARLSQAEMNQTLEGGWTATAHLLHLAFWDRRVAMVVDRFRATAEEPGPYDPDVVNDSMLPQWRLLTASEALSELRAAGDLANAAVAALTEDQVTAISSSKNVRVARYVHRGMHLADIERSFGA